MGLPDGPKSFRIGLVVIRLYAIASSPKSKQHYPAFTRNKLFFPRNRKEALDMNYKHWVNFLSAADNVSIVTVVI